MTGGRGGGEALCAFAVCCAEAVPLPPKNKQCVLGLLSMENLSKKICSTWNLGDSHKSCIFDINALNAVKAHCF